MFCCLFPSCSYKSNQQEASTTKEKAETNKIKLSTQRTNEQNSLLAELLEIENPSLEDSRLAFERLQLFEICIEKIRTKSTPSSTLESIGNCIQEMDLTAKSYQNSFIQNLLFGYSDCDINSMLYLLAADAKKWPIQGVFAPEHMFVVWNKNKSDQLYWETLSNSKKDPRSFLKDTALDYSQDCSGRFYSPINKEEILALLHYNRALDQHARRNIDQGVAALYQAILLAPEWVAPWFALARFQAEIGAWDEAEISFEKALALCPALKQVKADYLSFLLQIGCLDRYYDLQGLTKSESGKSSNKY